MPDILGLQPAIDKIKALLPDEAAIIQQALAALDTDAHEILDRLNGATLTLNIPPRATKTSQ